MIRHSLLVLANAVSIFCVDEGAGGLNRESVQLGRMDFRFVAGLQIVFSANLPLGVVDKWANPWRWN